MQLTVQGETTPRAFVPDVAAVTPVSREDYIESFTANLYNEIDSFYTTLESLNDMDDVQKFENISAMSARASHLRNQLTRAGAKKDSRLDYCKTNFIDPFLKEVDRQFRVHSRVFSVSESERQMLG